MDTFTMQEAFDSEGFCYLKDKKNKLFVLGALPAEEVTATLVGRKRKEIFHILDQVIKPSPLRVSAPCQDVPRCGGCVFQMLDYSAQLKFKHDRIKTLFSAFENLVRPIIKSPKLFGYRSKMEFSFSQNKAGEKFLGLTQAKGNGRVINTQKCHLGSDWMSDVLNIIQAHFKASHLEAYDRKGKGDLRSLTVRQSSFTQEKMVILEVVAHDQSKLSKNDIEAFFKPLFEKDPSISCYLRVVQMIPKVPTQIYEMHLKGPECIHEVLTIGDRTLKFKISPSAFFQPNAYSAELLFNEVANIVSSLKPERVLDLFSGTGTISLCISAFTKTCIGVELNPYSVFDAEENARINQIDNVSFIKQDAAVFIKENKDPFDLVIVDPPRAGLGHKACAMLKDLAPYHILYVSCNPVTQALDCHILLEAGYTITLIQPVDQFPHTNHCENIILLKKQKDCMDKGA